MAYYGSSLSQNGATEVVARIFKSKYLQAAISHVRGAIGYNCDSDFGGKLAEPWIAVLKRARYNQWRAGICSGNSLLAAWSTLLPAYSQLPFFLAVHVAVNHQLSLLAQYEQRVQGPAYFGRSR